MKTKEKLIQAFTNLLEASTTECLIREMVEVDIPEFKSKCENRFETILKLVPKELKSKLEFSKGKSVFIKPKDSKELIHIFRVDSYISSYFDDYELKDKKITFNKRREKFKELSEIYLNIGLTPNRSYNGGWDGSEWDGIVSKKETYAICYGQILRELTFEEYRDLINKYLDRLCELDKQYINSKANWNKI